MHGAFTGLFLVLRLNLYRKRLPGMNKGPLAIKGGDMNALQPMEELERRVQALEEAIESEASAFKGRYLTHSSLCDRNPHSNHHFIPRRTF